MKFSQIDKSKVWVKTAQMGSCWCGDCYCWVFPNGEIQYHGEYPWQKSDRFKPDFSSGSLPSRPYGSELSKADYEKALEMLK